MSGYKTKWLIWKEAEGAAKETKSKDLLADFEKIVSVGKIIQEEVDNSFTEPDPITELKNKERSTLKSNNG